MRLLLSTLLLLLFALPASALDLNGKCQIQFFGSSTLHDFEGVGACHPITLALTDKDGRYQLDDIELRVPIEMMATGNKTRDRQMYEMFESQSYPEIIGRLQPSSLDKIRRKLHSAADEGWSFPLTLQIHGVEQQVIARVTQLVDSDRAFAVDFKFHLALADFGMEPPTALWVVKVDNHVLVKVKIQLETLPKSRDGKF